MTRVWIQIGAVGFMVALAVSAWVAPELRVLHVLQGLIYVAVIVLARRDSTWGFGAGFTIALAWNSLNLFVTRLAQQGAVAFWLLLRTGQVHRLDTMMVAFATVAHFILMIACVAAARRTKQWWRFAGGGLIALAYFALIIAVAAPR